jgi:uncharacterized membrane protein
VVALVGIDIGGKGDELLGALAILVVAFLYAIGPMIVKRRLSDVDPLGPVAASLGIAALLVTPFAAASLPDSAPSPTRSRRVVVLGLLCSALAFLFFFRLIAEVGPGRATVITYINPVVALALGVAILDESVTTGVGRGPAPDPRRLMAVHGRPRAAGPCRSRRPRPRAWPCTRFRGSRLANRCGFEGRVGRSRRRTYSCPVRWVGITWGELFMEGGASR